jgi:hypothetical protein
VPDAPLATGCGLTYTEFLQSGCNEVEDRGRVLFTGKRFLTMVVAIATTCAVLVPAAADAREREMTLISPEFTVRPYTHENKFLTLRPDDRHAPAKPGFITGWEEQVLVDADNPKGKPIPVQKVMVHHLLYFARGRKINGPMGCWGPSGFIGGRGEEHPSGKFGVQYPANIRQMFGIENRTPSGEVPQWTLNAMIMNHYDVPRRVRLRTKLTYVEDEERIPVEPFVIGCKPELKAMAYDVPGGGKPGSTFVHRTSWTVPQDFNGRIVLAHSHHHGGAKDHSLYSQTCGNRELLRAKAYHGLPSHPYNTIRLKLHEPGPIANDTFATDTGIPISAGETLNGVARHDNQYPHVASMGFWVLWVIRDDTVKPCSPVPKDIRSVSKPKRYARKPPFWRGQVPLYTKPRGPLQKYAGDLLPVGDTFFRPQRIEAKVGQTITWNFTGSTDPHTVTVANGPRGFSSLYLGSRSGTYSYTPTVKGKYNLYCYVHPLAMSQELVVK